MRISKGPYHGVTNNLLYSILTGGDCIGYANLEINNSEAVGLNPMEEAAYALLIIEADPSTTDKTKVIRFKEFDTIENPPTLSEGIPLGDLSVYEVKGKENLKNFMAIGIEAERIHSLKIQYYG